MSPESEQILNKIMHLSKSDRVEIADAILMSVPPDPEMEAAWQAEVERRIDEFDSGKGQCIPWEQVREQIESALERRRRRDA